MSISISIEEYELYQSFKEQIEEKKKEFFDLNMKIIEREDKMNERVILYEREKKIAYETLKIVNDEIIKARLVLEAIKKECNGNKMQIELLEKKIKMCATNPSLQELQELRNFVNKNRGWLCIEQCQKAPEYDYCHLIYQINYSYSCNKKATVETFRGSVLGPTFIILKEIYADYKNRKKWISYETSFKRKFWEKKQNFIFELIKIFSSLCTILAIVSKCVENISMLTRSLLLEKLPKKSFWFKIQFIFNFFL